MDIHLIWAQAQGGAFGRDNTLPWHLPEDLRHFVAHTKGLPIVMGRKTWDSLPHKPLPGRTNIVVSGRTEGLGTETVPSRAFAVTSLSAALAAAAATGSTTCVVIGGPGLLLEAMGRASIAHVTDIDLACPGADAFAPAIPADWHCAQEGAWLTSETGLRYRFQTWRPQTRG